MAKIDVDLPYFQSLQPHQFTWGMTDLVPVTPGTDVLPDTLGWWPRGVRANSGGDLVFRLINSEDDRTIAVTAGEVIIGPVAQVLAGSTCDPHVFR